MQKEDSRKKNIRIERSKTKAVTVVVFWMAALLLGVGAYRSPRVRAQGNTNTGLGVTKLPPDIYPDSLSRMPRARQDQFATDEERAAFAWVAAMAPTVAGTKGVLGPTGTRAQVPELAQAYRLMFNMLEKKCGVEPKYFELAVLVATRQSNNEVEWIDHEARGVKLLGPEVVEIIRNNQDPRGLEEKEALIIELGREVFHQPKVSSETFAGLERNFGRQGTLGISLTMGWYTANALLMHTYDQHADLGAKRPFPDLPATNKP